MTDFFYLNGQQNMIIVNWLRGLISDDEFEQILVEAKAMVRGRTNKISKWMGIGSLVQPGSDDFILGEDQLMPYYEYHTIVLSEAQFYNLTGWGICNCQDDKGRDWYLKADFENKWKGNPTVPTGPPTPIGSECPLTVTNFNDLNPINGYCRTDAELPNPPNPDITFFISCPDVCEKSLKERREKAMSGKKNAD